MSKFSLSWSFFSDEEIIRRSKIIVRVPADLKSTKFGRLSDKPGSECHWCHLDQRCHGHWGHIVLATYIMHPITGRSTCVLPVCPHSLRPAPHFVSDLYSAQHATTAAYANIVRANIQARKLHTNESYERLINAVDKLFSTKVKDPNRPPFLTRFKGKHGRLRHNILGKRVNLSARSVIVGDPALKYTEVGVPRTIADTLTIEERITNINCYKLQTEYCKDKDSCRDNKWEISNEYFKVGDIIRRPMRDGDLIILNRQPTLHRLSMLAFNARIVPYSTIRIPPVVTKGFNADFDGDEMNIFSVSSQAARAEALCLMHVSQHKEAVHLIHDTKLEAHLEGKTVTPTDDEARYGLLENMRLRGFSVGWDDVCSGARNMTFSDEQNVHNVKNLAMRAVADAEPQNSPWRKMIEAKSKGNWANLCAIKATLGQQFVLGKHPKPIHSWNTHTRENLGWIASSYRQGLNAKEFFYHCMAGREGLIDTAVRTADAGYTHRKIARYLEDVRKCHDRTVRDEYANIVAFPDTPAASFGDPGAYVGIDAAHHIGEPATQLTLNTFHSSGAINEITTSGLKRLNELLRWTKKPDICISTIDERLVSKRTDWVLRATTLDTFTESRDSTHITIDTDALLRYDTDIHYVAKKINGTVQKNKIRFDEPVDADTHITGVKNIIMVNKNSVLHKGTLPNILYGTNGAPQTPSHVNSIFGIEAARTVFIRQMKMVLPQVHDKYIELLADTVTFEGKPRPMHHSSFANKNVFKSASFERAQKVFPDAAKKNITEPIIGLSEKIIFDQIDTLPFTTAY